jgi:hypothetical protein
VLIDGHRRVNGLEDVILLISLTFFLQYTGYTHRCGRRSLLYFVYS